MHYITHYCQSFILKNKEFLAAFESAFRPNPRYPSFPLEALDKCLAGFHFENALSEPAPDNRVRERPDLKVWAKLTVAAMTNSHPSYRLDIQAEPLMQEKHYYALVGSIYCHWDNLLRAMASATEYEGFDDDAKTQELIEICEILKVPAFSQYIQDSGNILPNSSKHAVCPSSPTFPDGFPGKYILVQFNGVHFVKRRQKNGSSFPCQCSSKYPPHGYWRIILDPAAHSPEHISLHTQWFRPRRSPLAS